MSRSEVILSGLTNSGDASASTIEQETFQFEREYDVTPFNLFPCCIHMRKTIQIGKDEVRIESIMQNCIDKHNRKEKRPYAQLGKVDVSMNCCCFCWQQWHVVIDQNVLYPGFGCDKALIQTIAADLQDKKVKRGNIQLIKNSETIMEYLDDITEIVDAMLKTKVTDVQPLPATLPRIRIPRYENKEYDVTFYPIDGCGGCLTQCGWFKSTIILEQEELVKIDLTPCYQSTEHRPYAQLGSVSRIDDTFKCAFTPPWTGCKRIGGHGVAIDQWMVVPKYGFEIDLVDSLNADLQTRKVERGNIAQLQRSEKSIETVELLKRKIDILNSSNSNRSGISFF